MPSRTVAASGFAGDIKVELTGIAGRPLTMLETVEAMYENGRITLLEKPRGVRHGRVFVTFVPDAPATPKRARRQPLIQTAAKTQARVKVMGAWIERMEKLAGQIDASWATDQSACEVLAEMRR